MELLIVCAILLIIGALVLNHFNGGKGFSQISDDDFARLMAQEASRTPRTPVTRGMGVQVAIRSTWALQASKTA